MHETTHKQGRFHQLLPDQGDGSDAPSLKLESFSAFTYDPVGAINRRHGRNLTPVFGATQGLRETAGYEKNVPIECFHETDSANMTIMRKECAHRMCPRDRQRFLF